MNLIIDKRFVCLVILAAGFTGVKHSAFGETIHVNSDGTGDYPTIQAAIDASSNGDVVELANGVYTGAENRNLDYNGKLICVRSASGDPESCILDCERQGRGFFFNSDEDLSAKVEGLTVRNGNAQADSVPRLLIGYGGAVVLCHGMATFERCRFEQNEAGIAGGVVVFEAGAVFHDCVIQDNECAMTGGGIFCEKSSLHMYHCLVSRNSAVYTGGGGIADYDSTIVLVDVTFAENASPQHQGGGLFCNFTTLLAVDCTFEKNTAGYDAGGIRIANGLDHVTLLNCQFIGNSAGMYGGGILMYNNLGFVDLIGCVFTQNRAASGGGIGIYTENLPIIHDCTIMNNFAEENGGGIYIFPPR